MSVDGNGGIKATVLVLGFILALVGQAAIGFYWGGKIDARVASVQEQIRDQLADVRTREQRIRLLEQIVSRQDAMLASLTADMKAEKAKKR